MSVIPPQISNLASAPAREFFIVEVQRRWLLRELGGEVGGVLPADPTYLALVDLSDRIIEDHSVDVDLYFQDPLIVSALDSLRQRVANLNVNAASVGARPARDVLSSLRANPGVSTAAGAAAGFRGSLPSCILGRIGIFMWEQSRAFIERIWTDNCCHDKNLLYEAFPSLNPNTSPPDETRTSGRGAAGEEGLAAGTSGRATAPRKVSPASTLLQSPAAVALGTVCSESLFQLRSSATSVFRFMIPTLDPPNPSALLWGLTCCQSDLRFLISFSSFRQLCKNNIVPFPPLFLLPPMYFCFWPVDTPEKADAAVKCIRAQLQLEASGDRPRILGVSTRSNLGFVPGEGIMAPAEHACAGGSLPCPALAEALDLASRSPSSGAAHPSSAGTLSGTGAVHILTLSTRAAAYIFQLGPLKTRTSARRLGPNATPSLPTSLVDLLKDPNIFKAARPVNGRHPLYQVGRQHDIMFRQNVIRGEMDLTQLASEKTGRAKVACTLARLSAQVLGELYVPCRRDILTDWSRVGSHSPHEVLQSPAAEAHVAARLAARLSLIDFAPSSSTAAADAALAAASPDAIMVEDAVSSLNASLAAHAHGEPGVPRTDPMDCDSEQPSSPLNPQAVPTPSRGLGTAAPDPLSGGSRLGGAAATNPAAAAAAAGNPRPAPSPRPPTGAAPTLSHEEEVRRASGPIKEDVLHVFLRLAEGCVNQSDPLFRLFMGSLKWAFFVVNMKDREAFVNQLRHLRNMSPADISRLPSRVFDRHVRRHIPLPLTLAARFTSVIQAFSRFEIDQEKGKPRPFFKKDMERICNNVMDHILKGCLSDPPGVSMYYDISRDLESMLPVYHTFRGTNKNENFHLTLKSVLRAFNTSPELANALAANFVYRFNNASALRYMHEPGACVDVHDIALLDDAYSVTKDAFGSAWPLSGHIPTIFFTKADILGAGVEFGCTKLLPDIAATSTQAALAPVTTAQEGGGGGGAHRLSHRPIQPLRPLLGS